MRRVYCLLPLILLSPAAAEKIDSGTAKPNEAGTILFYDIRPLGIEGQGWTELAAPYDRLPAKAQAVVRPAVWKLSHHSAGVCARFITDATAIHARWTLTSPDLAMRHMPATGVSGLDLYVKTEEGKWRWLAIGEPSGQTTSTELVKDLPPGTREYLLYLPLYNGVSSVEIGIPKNATLRKAKARPADKARPIVFYGTSITHGACASRPGMCHPAILGRRLDRPVINLGFSGNGFMEPEMAALLAELDPAVFVIDCLPNMGGDGEGILKRATALVQRIRAARPSTPILLVEDRTYPDAFLLEKNRRKNENGRAALRKVYESFVNERDRNIHYLEGERLLGSDGEDTVDGSHPTDLGFVRYANAFEPILQRLLNEP